MQNLLAATHQYEITRLNAWCQSQLCQFISVAGVCSVLVQASLYEAEALERACLVYVKTHFQSVVCTSAFGSLAREWPGVSLKINLHMAGVDEAVATLAIEAVAAEDGQNSSSISGGASGGGGGSSSSSSSSNRSSSAGSKRKRAVASD
jgi:uncharacterized membrane protein YgcG